MRINNIKGTSKNWKFLLPEGEGEDEGEGNQCFIPLTLTLSRRERGFLEVPLIVSPREHRGHGE